MVQNFGERKHALGLGPNVDHNVRPGKLQDSAFNYVVLALGFFGLGGEALKRGSEIVGTGSGWLLVLDIRLRGGFMVGGFGVGSFREIGALLQCGGRRTQVIGGVVVEQGHGLSGVLTIEAGAH